MAINRDRIDKNAFSIQPLSASSEDNAFWHSKTPYERLEALELQRQIIYGYRPSSARLQRFLTITQRSSS